MNCLKIILLAACFELLTHLGISVNNDFTSKQGIEETAPTIEILQETKCELEKVAVKYFPITINLSRGF